MVNLGYGCISPLKILASLYNSICPIYVKLDISLIDFSRSTNPVEDRAKCHTHPTFGGKWSMKCQISCPRERWKFYFLPSDTCTCSHHFSLLHPGQGYISSLVLSTYKLMVGHAKTIGAIVINILCTRFVNFCLRSKRRLV